MNLVQLLLPTCDEEGKRFPEECYARVERELTERFGGLTAYVRAPAKGLWEERPGETKRDDILVYEVMVDSLDAAWWRQYRESLQRTFRQEEMVVRAQAMTRL